MKLFIACFFYFSCGVACFAQERVILDTDIDSDVDDVEALAMLHALANKQQVNFLGVIVTSDDPYAPLCVSAINNYYKRPNLPIGFLQNEDSVVHRSRYKYTQQISDEFPRKLASHTQAAPAVSLYRKLLSQSPDSSVTILTIGHLTSLQQLLQSGSDKHSALNGIELVKKKTKRWLCMGGYYPSGKEANFYNPDPASTVYCVSHWPKQVIFGGWELGKNVITGGAYLRDRLPANSPIYRAYQLYNNFAGRSSWDQLSVFLLDERFSQFMETVKFGYNKINADGSNQWVTEKDHPSQEYLVFKPGVSLEELGRVLDDMVIEIK